MERDPDITGYRVVDRDGEEVGRVERMWEDERTGRTAYIAVKTGWLFGRTHLVPIDEARADDEGRSLMLPYEAGVVKDAPHVGNEEEMGYDTAQQVWEHYLKAREGEQKEMPLYGESIDVHKRVVESGAIRVRKETRREVVYEPVEVLRENVVVERLAPDEVEEAERHAAGRDDEFVMRQHEEQPFFEKHPEVMGGVRARRELQSEKREFPVERRIEELDVEREPRGPRDERMR